MSEPDSVRYCIGCGLHQDSPSCEVTELEIRGWHYERIRYVPRGAWERDSFADRCPDCGIWRGNFHHLGCELEGCPACEGQLIACGCDYSYRPSGLSRFPPEP